MRALTTANGRRLRFRWELLHGAGLPVVWPDGSRGRIANVVVGPFDYWGEALLVEREGGRVRVPVGLVRAIEPGRRVLLGPPPRRRLRLRRHRPQATPALALRAEAHA